MIQRVILAEHEKIVADNDQVPSEKNNNNQETENSIIVPARCSAKSKMAGSLDRDMCGDREH